MGVFYFPLRAHPWTKDDSFWIRVFILDFFFLLAVTKLIQHIIIPAALLCSSHSLHNQVCRMSPLSPYIQVPDVGAQKRFDVFDMPWLGVHTHLCTSHVHPCLWNLAFPCVINFVQLLLRSPLQCVWVLHRSAVCEQRRRGSVAVGKREVRLEAMNVCFTEQYKCRIPQTELSARLMLPPPAD